MIVSVIIIVMEAIRIWGHKFENGIKKYNISIGNSENTINISNILATIYCVAYLARVIILFMCTVYRQSYKLLLPMTQVIELVHLVFLIGRTDKEEQTILRADSDYFMRLIILPIVLYSSMRPSVIIIVSTHSVILFLIRPIFQDLTPSTLVLHFISFFLSVIAMAVYEKLIVIKIWSKLKLSLANDELLEVVNASNQGILIYCRETNRLLLQNKTAQTMFTST